MTKGELLQVLRSVRWAREPQFWEGVAAKRATTREGELGEYIQGLQDIPDEDYAEMLRPYAEAAAQEGKLALDWKAKGYQPHHGGVNVMADPRIPANDPEAFLKAAIERKNNLKSDFGTLYDRARFHAMTGTGIA